MPTFLCGHGNWYPQDGFARVPEGTTVTFYTQNAKTLWRVEAMKILDGTTQFQPKQLDVYEPPVSVPNMTLSDAGEDFRSACELAAAKRKDTWKLIFADPGNPKKLADLMVTLHGEKLEWIACRELRLKKVMGKLGNENVVVGARIGVNLRENPTTFYSAYIANRGERPGDIQKSTFRGFMPAGWNIPK